MSGQVKPRILCVSLSSPQLTAMSAMLPLRDYAVYTASTPEQAVAVCRSNHLAAIVLDSEFASESGWSVGQTLKIVNPELPILLLHKDHNGGSTPGVDVVVASHDRILDALQMLLSRRR
jgi:CheY-like chemotaxis protein